MFAILMTLPQFAVIGNTCFEGIPDWLCMLIQQDTSQVVVIASVLALTAAASLRLRSGDAR